MILWFLSAGLLGLSTKAQTQRFLPSSPCTPFHSAAFQDPHFKTRIANCHQLIKSGAIPNTEALTYTLDFLANNYKGLKDSNCAMETLDDDFNCAICKDPARVRQGIQNGCSFVLNDLKRPWGDGTTRTTGYFVDLCSSPTGPAVQKFYVNVGTGKFANDKKDKLSTLPGAFLTDESITEFIPYTPSKYSDLKEELKVLPAIRLVGVNSSNNSSEDSKPMHASPFASSSGCPSVGAASVPIMKELVKHGPALLMNYHSKQYEQGASCNNEGTNTRKRPRKAGGGLR